VARVNYPTLAIALHRQGKHTQAEEALAFAEQARDEWLECMLDGLIGDMPSAVTWWEWLEFNTLYREAVIEITGAPPTDDPRFNALRERSLAAITFGDIFAFMDAGREQIDRRAWDQAATEFVKVLDQLPSSFRGATHEMRFCLEMVQQPEVFHRLTKLRPGDRRLRYARGRVYANGRQWKEAVADLKESLELLKQENARSGATTETGPIIGRAASLQELAALHLLAGDAAAHRKLCKEVIQDLPPLGDPMSSSCFSRACTLAPDAVSDWSIPLNLARQAVRGQPRVAWHLYALGIAQHRAGEHAEAIESLKKSLNVRPDWMGRSQNHAVLALACQHLGRDQEARQWLNQANAALREADRTVATWKFGYAASDYLSDWLSTQVLLAEAERILSEEDAH
jgi:tetratricopeptide (TPR) repeat protein